MPQMREEGADIVIALSHSGIGDRRIRREPRERLAAARRRRRHRRDRHRPQPPRFPGHRSSERRRGRSTTPRARQRQAGRDGRLLGLASRPDRPDARARRQQLEDRRLDQPRRGRSSSASTGKVQPLVESKAEVESGGQGRPRGDARICPHAGRQDLGAALFLFRAGRRRPVGADRHPGADLVHQGHAEGHRAQGSAGAFGGRTLQVRRPRRPGLLHRRAGRRRGDQERRRPLPLSRTRCRRWRSPARRSRNGWRCRPASSTRSRRARPTSR